MVIYASSLLLKFINLYLSIEISEQFSYPQIISFKTSFNIICTILLFQRISWIKILYIFRSKLIVDILHTQPLVEYIVDVDIKAFNLNSMEFFSTMKSLVFCVSSDSGQT